MKQSNSGFICKCAICGKPDLVMSELTLKANYGSSYDGEVLQIDLCGNCTDKIFVSLSNEHRTFSAI